MLNRLMTSRRVRGILLTVVLLSAVVAILSVAIPLNRKRDAVTSLGEQSLSEASSLAMSMEYYNGLRIQSFAGITRAKRSFIRICAAFFPCAKQSPFLHRAYILYQAWKEESHIWQMRIMQRICRRVWITTPLEKNITDERYTRRCISILQEHV